MQEAVPAKPYQDIWQDPGYGLGLMKRRLPCGCWVWFHGGGGWNSIADNAATSDGRRSVAISFSSQLEPGQSLLEQAKTSAALIDRALCAT
jgi:D-alanyl-D-alanine carboxypeptidase